MSNKFEKAQKKVEKRFGKDKDEIIKKNRKVLDEKLIRIIKMGRKRRSKINVNQMQNVYTVKIHKKTCHFHQTLMDLFETRNSYQDQCSALEIHITHDKDKIGDTVSIHVDWNAFLNNSRRFASPPQLYGLLGAELVADKLKKIMESNEKKINDTIQNLFINPTLSQLSSYVSWSRVVLRVSTFKLPGPFQHFRNLKTECQKKFPYLEIFRDGGSHAIIIRVYWALYNYYLEQGIALKTPPQFNFYTSALTRPSPQRHPKSSNLMMVPDRERYVTESAKRYNEYVRERERDLPPAYPKVHQANDFPRSSSRQAEAEPFSPHQRLKDIEGDNDGWEPMPDLNDGWEPMPDFWPEDARASVKPKKYSKKSKKKSVTKKTVKVKTRLRKDRDEKKEQQVPLLASSESKSESAFTDTIKKDQPLVNLDIDPDIDLAPVIHSNHHEHSLYRASSLDDKFETTPDKGLYPDLENLPSPPTTLYSEFIQEKSQIKNQVSNEGQALMA